MTKKIVFQNDDFEWGYIDTEDVKLTGANPANRMRISSSDQLMVSMQAKGFLECYPILIDRLDYLADGNRRFTVSKMNNIDKMFYVKSKKFDWWELMGDNRTIKSWKAGDWDDAVLANSLVIPPPKVKNNHDKLRICAGPDALWAVRQAGMTSTIVTTLYHVMDYLSHPVTDTVFGQKVLLWMITQEQQNNVKVAMSFKVDPKAILKYIEEDEKIKFDVTA
jgi:hypothetical protein